MKEKDRGSRAEDQGRKDENKVLGKEKRMRRGNNPEQKLRTKEGTKMRMRSRTEAGAVAVAEAVAGA
jgi:hypothetical protein